MKLLLSPITMFLAVIASGGHEFADAFMLESTPVAALTTSLDQHQSMAKIWTITGSEPLRTLHVLSPGPVFVSYDPSLTSSASSHEDIVAKVVISGSSGRLIENFEIEEVNDDRGFVLRLPNDRINEHGYAVTQVFLSAKNVLNDVSTLSSGDIIINDDVLVHDRDAKLSLSAIGSGDIYVSSNEDLVVGSLNVDITGSGNVQVQAPSVSVSDNLKLSTVGSGDIALLADAISASELSSSIYNSGDQYVQTNQLKLTKLSASIFGSGDLSYSTGGSCVDAKISLAGSGDVYAGSIVCENSVVKVLGSGDVFVQATKQLAASIFGSGEVKYVNAPPAQISTKGLPFRRHQPKVKQAKRNKFHVYRPHAVPAVAAQYIKMNGSVVSLEDIDDDELSFDEDDFESEDSNESVDIDVRLPRDIRIGGHMIHIGEGGRHIQIDGHNIEIVDSDDHHPPVHIEGKKIESEDSLANIESLWAAPHWEDDDSEIDLPGIYIDGRNIRIKNGRHRIQIDGHNIDIENSDDNEDEYRRHRHIRIDGNDIDIGGYMNANAQSLFATTQMLPGHVSHEGFVVFVCVASALIAAGLAARKYRQHQIRQQYHAVV